LLIAGVLVGGPATRMGGRPKGLMLAPEGVTIVERWRALLEGLGARVVLVGEHDAYAHLKLPALSDRPAGAGPLGGLVALLEHAAPEPALAFACDMPFVSAAIVERLRDAPLAYAVVAPRRDDRWEPLCARYDPTRVLPVARRRLQEGRRSLQRLIDEVGGVELPLAEDEARQLHDWDSPADSGGR
jgi:molybdopterin-guanine dinucleotide biosynthesis protein A